MPRGLKGNSLTGEVEGEIKDSGYYNFNVEVADGNGDSSAVFVTVNVQPKSTLKTHKIVEVEANSYINFNMKGLESEQVSADNELFKNLDIVDTRKGIVGDAKHAAAVATLRVSKAQASVKATQKLVMEAQADKDFAVDRLRLNEKTLKAAQQNLALALLEQNQAAVRLSEARTTVEDATIRFNKAQKVLERAGDALVEAKAQMQKCEEELRAANTQKDAAQEEYDRAFTDLENANTQLEDAKIRKEFADEAVKAAKDALELAQQARDDAEADLNRADYNLELAEKALEAALFKVASIRAKLEAAKSALGDSKWEWEIVINKLYVAQARKEAADRASAIALAEGSLSDHNVNNGYNGIGSKGTTFNGCGINTYPLISGTSQVVSTNAEGYRLASGHNIIYGSCSEVTQCAAGDIISYNGYIVNGVVNAIRINKVLLS